MKQVLIGIDVGSAWKRISHSAEHRQHIVWQ
jgi:hypothetical protein